MDFHDQFVLSRAPRPHPEGWKTRQSGSWYLASHPSLPVTPLVDPAGATSGWLLGWAVDGGGEMLHLRDSLPLETAVDAGGDVESRLYQLAGRWTCVLLGDAPRCYVDPAGSLAVVYSAADQALASTTTVLRWGAHRDRRERFARRTLRPDQFHPAGLTSEPGVLRLLPNHYVDLISWTAARHWPTAPLRRVVEQEAGARVETIARSTRELIEAVARRHEVVLPLTAGRDSRMLVSAARPVLDRCSFVTFDYADSRRTDVTYARRVAERFGLDLEVLPLAAVGEQDAMDYLERVGYDANEGKARDFHVATRHLPRDRAWATGFAGEVGRGFYWPANDAAFPDADALLPWMHLPVTPANREAMQSWVRTAVHQDVHELLDLAYLELRVGCWASPQLYGTTPFALSVMPLNQRRVFTAMLELPVAYRREQRMARAVAEAGWPELARLPYGRPPGVVGWAAGAQNVARKGRTRLARRLGR